MTNFSKSVTAWMTCFSMLVCSLPLHAQTSPANLCASDGTVIAFFNGVLTTKSKANKLLELLNRIHGDTLQNGEGIRYELMYNCTNGFDDFVETFEQRMKEQDGILSNRFDLFFETLTGGGSWWSSITNVIPGISNLLGELKADVQASITGNLTSMLGNPPTAVNYQEHRAKLDSFMQEGKKVTIQRERLQ